MILFLKRKLIKKILYYLNEVMGMIIDKFTKTIQIY